MTSRVRAYLRAAVAVALACVPVASVVTTAPAATLPRPQDSALFAGGHAHGTPSEGSFFPGAPCPGCPVIPLEVEQGSDVRFTGLDEEKHRVVSKKARRGRSLFSSAAVANGQSTLMLTGHLKPGRYEFVCSFHPTMVGALEVSDS